MSVIGSALVPRPRRRRATRLPWRSPGARLLPSMVRHSSKARTRARRAQRRGQEWDSRWSAPDLHHARPRGRCTRLVFRLLVVALPGEEPHDRAARWFVARPRGLAVRKGDDDVRAGPGAESTVEAGAQI